MKKKILTLIIVGIMMLLMVACGTKGKEYDPAAYQSILDEYTQKIKDATPGLVAEYDEESVELNGNINALGKLAKEKSAKLETIKDEGLQKMKDLMTENGHEEEKYTEWADQLEAVYTQYSEEVTAAYMELMAGQ